MGMSEYGPLAWLILRSKAIVRAASSWPKAHFPIFRISTYHVDLTKPSARKAVEISPLWNCATTYFE